MTCTITVSPTTVWGLEIKLRSTALVSSAFTHGNFLESPSLFRILRTIFLLGSMGLRQHTGTVL